MNISSYFSKQARKPHGLFGRFIMSMVFDRGNAFLNEFVNEQMDVQTDDRIIEIGFGTGKLISRMARQIDNGIIEGVDVSKEMVSIARNKNKKHIAKGKIKLAHGDFDLLPYKKESFSKVCSVNTLYFWPHPLSILRKISNILEPGGGLFLAFEDIKQLKQRKLDPKVFHLYEKNDLPALLDQSGFSGGIDVVSRKKGRLLFHCAIGKK